MMKTVVTFGCRLNASESECIKQFLEKAGVDDLLVVNTCAVTAEAERQARQMVRKLRRENPDKKIVVTGCSATVHPKMYEEMAEVDGIVPNVDKNRAVRFIAFSEKATKIPEVMVPKRGMPEEKAKTEEERFVGKKAFQGKEFGASFKGLFKNHRGGVPTSYEEKIYDGMLAQTIDHIYDVRDFVPLEKQKVPASDVVQEKHQAMVRLNKRYHASVSVTPRATDVKEIEGENAGAVLLDGFEDRARAFLPIQTGCNNGCTFCLIRIARGPAVSFPVEEIEQQALQFARQGFREIDLTGVDITSFKDGDLTLGRLIQRLLDILPNEVHLRLSSLDPAALDTSFDEALTDPRVLPFAHLSLQSGDATVLRRMARRHTPEDLHRLVARLRSIRPELAFGADVIVGFPGETEAMFQNTSRLIEACRIPLLHIFPYSDRPGTVANALTPKVTPEDKKRRAAQLRNVGLGVLKSALETLVGRNVKVLVEQEKDGDFLGKTEHFFGIRMKRLEVRRGTPSFHNEFWKVPERTVTQPQSVVSGHFYSVFVTAVEESPTGQRLVGNIVREL